jgi:hypothetical protein
VRFSTFATANPWRWFVRLLRTILLTRFSVPASAVARATPARTTSRTAASGNVSVALDSGRMRPARFQTGLSLAIRHIISQFNSPNDFERLRLQFEEPLMARGLTSATENEALLKALISYCDRMMVDDFRSPPACFFPTIHIQLDALVYSSNSEA